MAYGALKPIRAPEALTKRTHGMCWTGSPTSGRKWPLPLSPFPPGLGSREFKGVGVCRAASRSLSLPPILAPMAA